jgi:hypothetical protein
MLWPKVGEHLLIQEEGNMCEFISWKEVKTASGTEILFLTHDDIFNTSRGIKLRKHNGNNDLFGHGAIAFYYQISSDKGINRECTDFSSPDNFPPEIVAALKSGKMWGFIDYFPDGLLCAPLYADYKAKRDALDADYKAKRDALDADYEAKRDALYADYEAKRAPLDADYEAKRAPLDADYKAKRAPLDADYEAKCAPLDADYEAKRAPLYADYKAKRASLDADYEAKRAPLYADYKAKRASLDGEQWGLFLEPENRSEAWK